MQLITVSNDNARNIRFTGEVVACVETSPNNASCNYSGMTGRWDKYTLYRTKAGKYVCSIINYSQWQGSTDDYTAEVCDGVEEVIQFFGLSDLAKELYEKASIDYAVDVA